jgi:hypothetical protein
VREARRGRADNTPKPMSESTMIVMILLLTVTMMCGVIWQEGEK